jgi:hypothetical protein
MTDSNRELLQSIDAKLGGILVLIVDLYLRETRSCQTEAAQHRQGTL